VALQEMPPARARGCALRSLSQKIRCPETWIASTLRQAAGAFTAARPPPVRNAARTVSAPTVSSQCQRPAGRSAGIAYPTAMAPFDLTVPRNAGNGFPS
jgi:hypothetical protein